MGADVGSERAYSIRGGLTVLILLRGGISAHCLG